MKRLRILVGCAQAPLPEGSAVGRWGCALLHGLAAKGHRVTAFTACELESEARAVSELFRGPDLDVRCFISPVREGLACKFQTLRRPHSYAFSAETVRHWRAESTCDYDIVHLEGTFTGWL